MENLRDELYDTSDYPKGHSLHSQLNKKVIGKIKDHFGGCVPALQDVLHLARGRQKHKESKGHHQSRDKERDQPPELQGRPIWSANVQARDGQAPKQRPPDFRGAFQ